MATSAPVSSQRAFAAAVDCHRAGKLAEAERLYRRVPARDPNYASALFLLGSIALQRGRTGAAADLFRRTIAVDPSSAVAYANLGECYRRSGRTDDALHNFLRALRLRPDLAEPVFNLGLLLQDQGETDGAVACFERALELKPDAAQVRDRLAQARASRNDGGKGGEGPPGGPPVGVFSAKVLASVAATLSLSGQHEAVAVLCRKALDIDPQCADALNNLGVVLLEQLRFDDAVASLQRSVAADPLHAEAHCNLGNAWARSGRPDEALVAYRRSLELSPGPAIHSNILYMLPFHPGYEPKAILAEARDWDRQHGAPLAQRIVAHANDRNPDRRLRIGYLSPDFRAHCQTFYTVPLFRHHDHAQFEIIAYANVVHPDAFTQRVRGHTDLWRNIAEMTDDQVVGCMREDRIDILVDLTMHMDQNRMPIFACKPAPLQVCWLAYPGTTGLSTMDYRVTDPHIDPPGGDVSVYSERCIWLPDAFWCYDPLVARLPQPSQPPVGPLPAQPSGRITFGCLNNFAKVQPDVLALWARVMHEVDGSRLVMLAPEGEPRRRAHAVLESHGVDAGRVSFVGLRPHAQYLASYAEIDVCLDTFPYNGHTTSLDALWMGVPVVTLVGKTVVGRAGLCQAMNLGLKELVATTPEEYVGIAVALCANPERLGELRAALRARLESSPLMDGARFARNMEAAYRRIWRRWCAEQEPEELMV
jgi:predicted O-linked N-acetylglucosamine transferase (SPINDLY family)